MAEALVDVDLDALAPAPKRVRLGGKRYVLPGDMPLDLFMRIQAFGQRVEKGEDETAMLAELSGELLSLFQIHQPQLKELPKTMGVLVLLQSLGAIYGGGGGPGEARGRTPTSPQRKRTPSSTARKRASRATSR